MCYDYMHLCGFFSCDACVPSCRAEGKTVLPVAIPIIQDFLQKPEWRFRYVALLMIALIGEGCKKVCCPRPQLPLPALLSLVVLCTPMAFPNDRRVT